MPLRTFWLMNKNIDRIQAQNDMRSLVRSVTSQSGQEQIENYRKTLIAETGTIVKLEEGVTVIEAERDEAGFAELKSM